MHELMALMRRMVSRYVRWGRQDQRGVAGVHAGVLHVLGDGRGAHLASAGHRVDLELLGVLDELAHHHGMRRRNLTGLAE
jgi:hypothetical protein